MNDPKELVRLVSRITAISQALNHYAFVLDRDATIEDECYLALTERAAAFREAATSIHDALADRPPLVLSPAFASGYEDE